MQCVTAVDGHWLAELGPMFFSVKESTRTRLVCEEGKICNCWFGSGTREQDLSCSPSPYAHTFSHQEKKLAAKEKLSQMEAELVAASEELKSQKEEEKAKRIKSIK